MQMLALDMLDIMSSNAEAQLAKAKREFLENMFTNWLAVEHREIYDEMQKRKLAKEERDSYVDISELKADSMKELIIKARHKAAMEGDNARG